MYRVSRRKDGFQEEVTVVLAARPVAGTGALRHEVKAGRSLLPRIGVVAHPQQADYLEGDAPHREHGAESDASGEKTGGGEPLVECLFEPRYDHVEADTPGEAGNGLPFHQVHDDLPQGVKVSLPPFAGGEEGVEKR